MNFYSITWKFVGEKDFFLENKNGYFQLQDPFLGLNRTSRPVTVVLEFSNIRMPDFRFFFLPGLRTSNIFKVQEKP